MKLEGYSTYDLIINTKEKTMYWKRKDSEELHKIFDIDFGQYDIDWYSSWICDELERVYADIYNDALSDFDLDKIEEFLGHYKNRT